jgi:transposase
MLLMFADEAELSTHPYLACTWARRGENLTVQAPGKALKRALFGARVHGSEELMVNTARTKDSAAFCDFLNELKPRTQGRRVHLVLDNGPIHHSRLTRAALEQAQDRLSIEWLPGYAPELNDIERDWKHLKAHYLAHQAFVTIDRMERTVRQSVSDINRCRGCGQH